MRRIEPEKVAEMKRLYADGMCKTHIAKQLGVSYFTVDLYVSENGEEKRKQKNDSNKKYREMLKEFGICVSCGQKNAVPGMTKCEDCLYKDVMRRVKQSESPEYRKKVAERQMEKVKKLKAAGICVDCHHRPAEKGHVRCAICAGKAREYNQKRRVKSMNKENGLCIICGKPAVKGKCFCPKHYEMKCRIMARNASFVDSQHHPFRLQNDVYSKLYSRNARRVANNG